MILYLSKILPNLFLPIGVTFALVLVAAFTRKWIFVWFAVIVFYVCSIPLTGRLALRGIERGMERRPPAEFPKVDGIVVLSGGRPIAPGDAKVSEWADADRFFGGIELYKAGKAPHLVFTGGWAPWNPDAVIEGEILIRFATEYGIPEESLMTTGKVVNTAEEAAAVAAIFRSNQSSEDKPKILLVTSAFHMPRAGKQFELEGFEVVSFPVDFLSSGGVRLSLLDFIPTAQGLSETSLALRELYGRAFVAVFR